jgi:hypothetical protein
MGNKLEDARQILDKLNSQLQKHERLVRAIEEEPENYDDAKVEEYSSGIVEHFGDLDLVEPLKERVDQLEESVDSAEAEALASIRLIVEDREIEGVEIAEFAPEQNSAVAFIPSPKVNQTRGARQRLVTSDGDKYEFQIAQTLVADMEEDKTGTLKLVLDIEPVEN